MPASAPSSAGPCSRVSSPATRTVPAKRAAVEVRHQAAGGTQQRRLAVAGEAREHAELARVDVKLTSLSAGLGWPG